MKPGSFETFYLRHVALNEGCGCAEQIIGTRDLDRYWQNEAPERAGESTGGPARGWLRRLFRLRA